MQAAVIARSLPRRVLLVVLLWVCGVTSAAAHAPPEVRRLVFDPERNLRVLVANRGLIFRDGDALQLLCNEALMLSTDQLPAIVRLDDAKYIAATPLGLFQTQDRACSWQQQGSFTAALAPTSLVQAPDAPAQLWLAASAGVYVSADAGGSWELRWPAQPGDYLQDLLLAAGSAYVLRTRIDAGRAQYSVLQSTDDGHSWQEQPLTLHDDEQPALLALDPHEPARVLAKAAPSSGAQRQRLLVSRDAGKSFASPLSLYAISAASWSEDGARAWVASEEGLFLSTDGGESFARVGPGELLTCVEEHAGRLYTCGFLAGISAQQQGVGVSDDGGNSFEALALFRDVQATLSCEADAETQRRCELPWRDWQAELGVPDAGPTVRAKPAKHSSGCSALPRSGAGDLGAVLLLLAACAHLLRRKLSAAGAA